MNRVRQVSLREDFVPQRLREARLAQLWSLEDLAERVGVSRQAISQYEMGLSTPSPDVLGKLARALNRPISFFGWSTDAQDLGTSVTYYRKQKRVPLKYVGPVNVYLTWLYDISRRLEQWVDLPPVTIHPLELEETSLSQEALEAAAHATRDMMRLGAGPIAHITRLFEHHGILVAHWPFSQAPVDAGSRWICGRPLILIGREGISLARQRFGLAHELGHLVLHAALQESEYQKRYAAIEREANYFASAFLMPEDTFRRECVMPSLSFLQRLKSRWGASLQAIISRAGALGVFTVDDVDRLYRQISAKGWRKQEPGDQDYAVEEPAVFEQALELVHQETPHIYSLLRDEIPLALDEVGALTHVPPEEWERNAFRVVHRSNLRPQGSS